MKPLEERVAYLEGVIAQLVVSDRYIFQKKIEILNGRNIQVGITDGTKIGTLPTQKLSVFGVTPVVQAAAITAPTGGGTVDSQARAAVNSLITAIKNFGITA